MGALLYQTFFGKVEQTGERQITYRYPGTAGTLGLGLVLLLWSASVVMMLVAIITTGELGPIGLVVAAVIACAGMAALIRFRVRRMGWYVADGDGGTLTYHRGQTEQGRWRADQITFERCWDPIHRGWGMHYWLVARVPDGRRLRLAKGLDNQVEPLLKQLAAMGFEAKTKK